MRTPAKAKASGAATKKSPPGGRALERVRQDQAARGLTPKAPAGKLVIEGEGPAAKKVPAKKKPAARRP
jgi:hypothetical protein